MSTEMLMYPFLFLAIFLVSFLLITMLSAPARKARNRTIKESMPTVAIIVPCWNEASTVARTCESLLALDYPKDKLEIILVDDGSTDATPEVMSQFANIPQVQIIRKPNGGKHTALNAGIKNTNAELIGCLDADSFVEARALHEIVACFKDPEVMAATPAMTVHEPKNLLQHMQNAEYILGITLKHVLASINGLYVTPGPFSFYRHDIINKLGGFKYGHQTEDMEMALRIQKAGYKIENAPYARVVTKVPNTIPKLLRQRTRWISGFLRNIFGEYRCLVGNRKYGVLGLLVLPTAILYVVGSIFLFVLMIFIFTRNTYMALELRYGIPFYYAFVPNFSFDWFYIHINSFTVLAIITLLASIILIVIGKRISKSPDRLFWGIIPYIFLYGLIAPIWCMRAIIDTTFGIKRNWRN